MTPVSWESLWATLRRIVPGVARPTVMGVLDRLHYLKWVPDWERVPEWEGLDDAVILEQLLAETDLPAESLAVISTNHSQFKSTPSTISLSHLRRFVAEHRANFRECFFNGDTLIAFPDAGIVLGLQHDGYAFRYPARSEFPTW